MRYKGGGISWHFNFAWEISRFKLTAKFRVLGECLPSTCPARYLCIKYLMSSPRFILTLGSPPSRPH